MRPQLSILVRNFAGAPVADWEPLFRFAEMVEAAGIDRLVVVDHVGLGDDLGAYGDPRSGGVRGGVQPTGPDGSWLEPLTVLSVLAGRTSTIRLATGILQAALRRPVVLAKTVATLDVLSRGRLDLGVGVGWQRAEYEAADLAFSGRGRLLNETLELCARLWNDGHLELPDAGRIHQMPRPIQAVGPGGGVPIWVSGRSSNPRVIERIVRFGSGWIPWGDDAADPRPGIARIRAALAEAGDPDRSFQVTAALPRSEAATRDLIDCGVTDFRVPSADWTEAGLADVVEQFRAAVA